MKKISVIVPVYNTKEEYLRKCLCSIINQTIKNDIEIIIIDDGSEKDCAKVCDEYATNYEFIQVIHQANKGLATSRNIGMQHASGQWIMFVDSDDWVENNICEKLLENIDNETDIVISSVNMCYPNKTEPVKMFNDQCAQWYKNSNTPELYIISGFVFKDKNYKTTLLTIANAKLYRTNFIKKNGLDNICNLKFKEDNIFNLYCFEHAKKIVYKNYYLYNYRQCATSLIHKNSLNMINPYIEFLKEEKNFIVKYNKPSIFYTAYRIRSIESLINIIGQYIFKTKCSYLQKHKKIKELMNLEIFKDALKNIDTSYLGKYLKLMVYLLKFKMFISVNILYNLREKIKNKNQTNLYD